MPRDFRTLTKWHTEARRELRINKYKAMTGTETPSGHGAKEGVCELYPRRSLNSVCRLSLLLHISEKPYLFRVVLMRMIDNIRKILSFILDIFLIV